MKLKSAFFTDKYSFIEVLFRPELVGPKIASVGETGNSWSEIDEINTGVPLCVKQLI